MKLEEVKDFAEYEVYEIVEGKKHTICICKEEKMAQTICCMCALNDKSGDTYYYTNITQQDTWVVGGGWYKGYKCVNGKIKEIIME